MTKNALEARKLAEAERHNRKQEYIDERKIDVDDEHRTRDRRSRNVGNVLNTISTLGSAATKSLNDVEWYVRDASTRGDIASLPWKYAFGAPTKGVEDYLRRMPAVVTLHLMPSIGVSKTPSSGVNVAAQQFYSWVRHSNSGSAIGDPVDHMEYLLAVGNLYAFVGAAGRLLGLLQTFEKDNLYLPNSVLIATGVPESSVNEWFGSIAQLRAWLNSFIRRINEAFSAPKDVTYFARQFFLYSNLFKDEENDRGQIYAYVPHRFFQYDEAAGKLSLFVPSTMFTSFATLRSAGETLFNSLMRSESVGVISGDIRKAYQSDLYTLPEYSENHMVHPVHDVMVLDQMHNATIVPNGFDIFDPEVTQDESGNLVYAPKIGTNSLTFDTRAMANFATLPARKTQLLSVHNDNPGPDQVIESTRLKFYIGEVRSESRGSDTYHIADITTCGTELVTAANIWTYGPDYTVVPAPITTTAMGIPGVIEPSVFSLGYLPGMINCEYAPAGYLCVADDTSLNNPRVIPYFNVRQYTPISDTTLSLMNETILLDMFSTRAARNRR